MQMRIKKPEKTQSTLFESGQPDSAFFFLSFSILLSAGGKLRVSDSE